MITNGHSNVYFFLFFFIVVQYLFLKFLHVSTHYNKAYWLINKTSPIANKIQIYFQNNHIAEQDL